jgi:predicted DNA-binding transcriptional regulator AlpA
MATGNDPNNGVTIDPDGIEWWSLTALAAALCTSTKNASRWARREGFPQAYQFGPGTIRWRAEAIRSWREEQLRPGPLASPANWQPTRTGAAKGRNRGPRAKAAA